MSHAVLLRCPLTRRLLTGYSRTCLFTSPDCGTVKHQEFEALRNMVQGGILGRAGLTPFHLSVFLSEPEPAALLLCKSLGASHWFTTASQDGHTPADFAACCGRDFLNHAISKSLWSQASEDSAGCEASSEEQQAYTQGQQRAIAGCSEERQSSAATSSCCWSDSSSSADDESGSDVDASLHGGTSLSAMPGRNSYQQKLRALLGATDFIRDRRERLAAVIRNRWAPY